MTSPEKLRRIRKEKKLTQEQLASLVGISRSTLTHYEEKNHRISPNMLRWLANALHIDIQDLQPD